MTKLIDYKLSDYIKRSNALTPFTFAKDGTRYHLTDCDNFPIQVPLRDVQKILRNVPAEDVIKITRCKDCKYWKMIYQHYGECLCRNIPVEIGESFFPAHDFYCAYGEKENEKGDL